MSALRHCLLLPARQLAGLLIGVFLMLSAFSVLAGSDDAPAPPPTTPLAWLEGRWDVAYDDAVRGEIRGSAVMELASLGALPVTGQVLFPDPETGGIYSLDLVKITPLADPGPDGLVRKVRLTFFGNSPPSRSGGRDGQDNSILPVVEGDTVTASLGDNSASAAVGPPPQPRNLELTLTAPEGRFAAVAGEWRYFAGDPAAMDGNRAGSFDADSRLASGSESWTRFDTRLLEVAHVLGPTPAEAIATAWSRAQQRRGRDAAPNAEELPDFEGSFGDLWLTATGIELPVEAARAISVTFGPAPGAEDSDNHSRIRFLKARRNARDPRLLDIRVALDEGFADLPVLVTVNGSSAVWDPALPDEPRLLRFVRANNVGFEPLERAYPGDVVYLEAIYGRAPPLASPRFALSGAQAPQRAELALGLEPAEAAGGGVLYRSGRILLLDPSMPDPVAGQVEALREYGLSGTPPLVLRLPLEATLAANRADGPGGAGARLRLTDPPPSLWERALIEARLCRGLGAETEATNYILTNILTSDSVRQSVPITLRDHAAALLLLDELNRAMGGFIADIDAQGRARMSSADLRREAMILVAMARRGMSNPLFAQRVSAVDLIDGQLVVRPGSNARLDEALSPVEFDEIMRRQPERFLNFAIAQIARAKGQARDYATKARSRLQATDRCDVVTVLGRVGLGTAPLAEKLLPRLLRRPTGDEPPYPAWRPDAVARAAVLGVHSVAGAVRAQQEAADIDTELASLPLLLAGPVGQALFEVTDLMVLARDTQQFADALQDEQAALGVATVGSEEALAAARARKLEKALGVATNAAGAMGGAALSGGGTQAVGEAVGEAVSEAASRGVRLTLPEAAADAAAARALRDGLESLSETERRLLSATDTDLLPPDLPKRPALDEELADSFRTAETKRFTDEEELAEAETVILSPEENPFLNGDQTVREPALNTGGVDPYAETQREINTGGVDPYAETRREINTGEVDPYAETQRELNTGGVDPYAETQRELNTGEVDPYAETRREINTGEVDPYAETQREINTGGVDPHAETQRELNTGGVDPHAETRREINTGGVDPYAETVILAPEENPGLNWPRPAGPATSVKSSPVEISRPRPDTTPDTPRAPPATGPAGQIRLAGADGREVSIALDKRLGVGGYNEVFTIAGRDDAVVRLSLGPASGPDFDGFGRRQIENALRGEADAPINIVRRIEDIPGLPGGYVDALDSPDPALAGKQLEVVEFVPEGPASSQIARQGGMTPGQAVAFDEAMRWLNARGLVWLDNHPGNFSFRALGDDRWKLLVLDPGGIVPATASDIGDAAATASWVQRALDAPGEEFREAFDVGTLELRWQLKREVIQEEILPGRVDLQALGLESALDMPFNAASVEPFAALSRLRALDDAAAAEARAALRQGDGLIQQVNPKTGAPLDAAAEQ